MNKGPSICLRKRNLDRNPRLANNSYLPSPPLPSASWELEVTTTGVLECLLCFKNSVDMLTVRPTWRVVGRDRKRRELAFSEHLLMTVTAFPM